MDVLIVYGYHPKETFAVKVGEHLLGNNSSKKIKIVRYDGRQDRNTSTYRLRKFVEKFNPAVSPIILHDDAKFDPFTGSIIYSAKSKEEKRKVARHLSEFVLMDGSLAGFGRFLALNTSYNIIDIELNPIMGLDKGVSLVERFSKYILRLYLDKGIKF